MTFLKSLKIGATAVALTVIAGAANAATVFVGSWQVDSGPNWQTVPAALTGQEAAAFLFGGTASDYAISSVDNSVANIDNLAWVTTWGGVCDGNFPCGTTVAENFKISTGGLYASVGDTSAYAQDWAVGSQYTNYAFLIDAVPEPGTWALMIGGFAMTGFAMRRKVALAA